MTTEVTQPAETAPRIHMKPRQLPLREQMGFGAAIVKSARPANTFRPAGGIPTTAVTAPSSATPAPIAPAPVAVVEAVTAPEPLLEPALTLDEPEAAPFFAPPPPAPPTILADETSEHPDLAPDSVDAPGIDALATVATPVVVEPAASEPATPVAVAVAETVPEPVIPEPTISDRAVFEPAETKPVETEPAIAEPAQQAIRPFARRRTDTVASATVAAEEQRSSKPSAFTTRIEPERPDRGINIPEFLRSLGVLPEQVSANEMNARIEADLALDRLEAMRQSRMLADGKAELAPFYIFPVEFWQTDPDQLLANSLGVWPSAPWNRAFLPLTVLGALSLNSVPHPRETTSDQFVFADRVLGEAQAELSQLRPLYERLSQDALFSAAGMNTLIAKKRALEEVMKQAAGQYLFELRAKWHQSKGW